MMQSVWVADSHRIGVRGLRIVFCVAAESEMRFSSKKSENMVDK